MARGTAPSLSRFLKGGTPSQINGMWYADRIWLISLWWEAIQSSEYGKRTFCGQCGSVTPVVEEETGVVFCPAGNLDGEFGIRVQSHRFPGSKLPWHTVPVV